MLPEQIRKILREKRKITVAEYLQLPETTIHMELIDGMLYIYDGQEGNMPAPKDFHQQLSSVIFVFLANHFPAKQLRAAPTDVHIGDNIVQPDIFWVNPHSEQCVLMPDGYLHGAPDFVVEILSPSTHRHDRVAKFDLYDQHGVREYWIVDPDEQYIEVYTRHQNTLMRLGGYQVGQTFTSPILNHAPVDVSALLTL